MKQENSERTFVYICPRCLIEYGLCIGEIKKRTPKCDYCGIPLVSIKN